MGVVPVCSRKRRLKLRSLMPQRPAIAAKVRCSPRWSSIHAMTGSSTEPLGSGGWHLSIQPRSTGPGPLSALVHDVIAPILIGILYAFLMSMLREPARRRFNAIMVAGAGAAYLSSSHGFGAWEFVFTAVIT